MKEVKFLGEVISFSSIVPILVFAKLTYAGSMDVGAVAKPAANKLTVSNKQAEPAHQPAPYPGLINSRFIIVNY